MKKITLLAAISFCILFSKLYAQVGIGTATPNAAAMLHVDAGTSLTKGLLITGTYNLSATFPDLGAGSRLMFYPAKAAFRAGFVSATQWNNGFVENYSIAMGDNTTASGNYSTAIGSNSTASGNVSFAIGAYTTASGVGSFGMGENNTASGEGSFVMGSSNLASGNASTAMGSGNVASGLFSTVMGSSNTAFGNYSTAMGSSNLASGNYSTAMGFSNTASGVVSTAMGKGTTASGNYSTAMGYGVSTNNQNGAFIIGDSDPLVQGTTLSGLTDQFVARFNNGYYLLTSGDASATRSGVSIAHNGNSWVSICDKNRKENFEPLNGEDVLQKLSAINFTSWNYKMQDPKSYRHYGIMAQDFNNAFGKDKYGVIGNDTTVNPIDMIGIDMAAIQALVKRTNELKNENQKLKNKDEAINKKLAEVTELKKENEKLKNQSAIQNKEIENLHKSVAQLQTSFSEQQKLIAQSLQQMKAITIKQIDKKLVVIK